MMLMWVGCIPLAQAISQLILGFSSFSRYPSTWNWENKEDRQAFLPDKHIFYAQRAIDVEDGQPKWEKMADESKEMSEEHVHGERGTAGSGSKKGAKKWIVIAAKSNL